MIKFLKRYVCSDSDYENKIVFYTIIVNKNNGSKEWVDVVVAGFKHFLTNPKFDKLVKGKFEIDEDKWKEIDDFLYQKLSLIDCKDESIYEFYEKGLQGISNKEFVEFLNKNAKPL